MLITEKFIRKIIKKALLLKENIKEKQSKAKGEIKTINSLLSALAKDHGNKMSNAAKEIGEPFSNGGKGVEYEAQNNFNQALASARLLGMRNEEIKSDANYKKLITALKEFAEESKTPTPDKGKGAGKFPQKKKKGPNPKIKEIQKLLNELKFTDYQGKKLSTDGKWGKRTRSSTSKMLKLINEGKAGTSSKKGLFDKLELNNLLNNPLFKKLKTGSAGPGSWKSLSIKLVKGKEIYKGGGKYPAVLAILGQFKAKNINGSNTGGKTEFVSPVTPDLPTRPKGQTWYEYYGRKEVRDGIVELFNKKYGIEVKTDPRFGDHIRSAGDPYSNFGDRYLSGKQPKNYDPVKGAEKGGGEYPGVVDMQLTQIKNKEGKFEPFAGGMILQIRFDGSVGTAGGSFEGNTKKKAIEQIKAVGGKADMFVKDWKNAKTGSVGATGLQQSYK